jgi:hypothetical protein
VIRGAGVFEVLTILIFASCWIRERQRTGPSRLRVNRSACPTYGASQNPAGLKTGATEGVKAHDENGVVVATVIAILVAT